MLRANEFRPRRPGRGELVGGTKQSSGLEDRVGLSEGDRSSVVDGKVKAKARRGGRRSAERREEETMAGRRRRLARLWVRASPAPGSRTVPGVAGRRLGAADGEGRVDEGCDGDRSSAIRAFCDGSSSRPLTPLRARLPRQLAPRQPYSTGHRDRLPADRLLRPPEPPPPPTVHAAALPPTAQFRPRSQLQASSRRPVAERGPLPAPGSSRAAALVLPTSPLQLAARPPPRPGSCR